MNSSKAPTRPTELDALFRREGLLSFLVASPMALLGCPSGEPNVETEGSSSGPMGSTSGSGSADSGSTSTGAPVTGDDTTSAGSSSSGGSSSTGPSDVSTSSSGAPDESTSSDGGEESTTGSGQGNTCERVGDLMDMCLGGGGYGYGYWYEYDCNWNINYWIGEGDIACAQAYNDFYSCIADLECAEVFMGPYESCGNEWDLVGVACDWGGGTDTFGDTFGDSGVIFLVPGSDSGGWSSATSDGGWNPGTDTDGGDWGATDSGWVPGTDTGFGGT